ncbi:hypothetical protein ED758_24570 [Escherichia coli]|nr:hypothetical protein [Escherichia coli]
MTDFGGKTSIFSHPVYLFLREFSLQDSRGGSPEPVITLISPYLQTLSPVIPPARPVSVRIPLYSITDWPPVSA